MSFSHSQLVERFKNGKRGTSSHMYIDGDVMYSYGRHFPLLVRTPWGTILNADNYSSSTSQHQSRCAEIATIQIPFSALSAAGIISYGRWENEIVEQFAKVELIDQSEARYDRIGYERVQDNRLVDHISVEEYEAMPVVEQYNWNERQERRPEAVVIKHEGNYYLSSMDGNNFFISLLPEPAEFVAEAFENLKPLEVKDMTECKYPNGRGAQHTEISIGEYARQGEWFFTKCHELPMNLFVKRETLSPNKLMKRLYKTMQSDFVLPRPDSSAHEHIATRGDVWNGQLCVSGSVRHKEHRMLRLSKADDPKLYSVYRNRAVNSWSASGSVD